MGSRLLERRCATADGFTMQRAPHIRAHRLRALRHGWPRVLVLNRPGTGARRERLLSNMPPRPGMDRDGYPPAIGRGMPPEVVRGAHPRGWKADVAYVPSSENRSQGAVMGADLRPYCNGTRFEYRFD